MMAFRNRIRTDPARLVVVPAGIFLAAAVAIAFGNGGSSAAGQTSAVGQPPPEWAANAGAWPAHNYDLANTRATTQTPINSQTVSKLKVKWTFSFRGAGGFGVFSSTPIFLNGTIYFQDLNSDVYAAAAGMKGVFTVR